MKNDNVQITVPAGSDFDVGISKSIDRRTAVRIEKDHIVLTRDYHVGRKNYTVSSFFEKEVNLENNIKYLIASEIERKNSSGL
jgi:uncharacterized protein with PIN domain